MSAGTPLAERGTQRVRELANIGAGHAATALARLVRRTIYMGVPRVAARTPGLVPEAASAADGGTAICFGLQGGMGGTMAVVFSRGSLEVLVTEMMGADAYGVDKAVESAVREAGNMLVSHYVSAMADALGTVVMPSVPLLTEPRELPAWLADLGDEPGGVVVECPLFDPDRSVVGFLIFVPCRALLRTD